MLEVWPPPSNQWIVKVKVEISKIHSSPGSLASCDPSRHNFDSKHETSKRTSFLVLLPRVMGAQLMQ